MVEDLYAKYYERPEEKIRVSVAPSNVHRCTDNLLVGLRELASKYETGIHIHLQETIYQKLYGLRTWNKTPLQHLKDLDFLGPDVVCGHGVWVTDEDIETMASHKVSLCHNASSNLRLKSGIAPVNYFLDKGLRIALGSDEAGLNDDKDWCRRCDLLSTFTESLEWKKFPRLRTKYFRWLPLMVHMPVPSVTVWGC